MFIKTLTVSALNSYIKKIINADFILNNVHVKGEISNLKIHSTGHIYFSLKDESSKINCIMFRANAQELSFIPEEGMKVVAKGRISIYEKEGAYQLYCSEMQQEGLGELFIRFQKLKDKLQKEGFFDEVYKKTVPIYPRRIGVITSPTGAAVRDIIHVATRRNRNADILIYPSLVQGSSAADNIIEGIKKMNNIEGIDVIILARGGGSIEELWAFNEEKLAQAIFNSKTPIITGVGHETDYTIADFVSDRRAPTPSAAAELAVVNQKEMNKRIESYKVLLYKSINNHLEMRYSKFNLLLKTLNLYSPQNYIVNQYNYIDKLNEVLKHKMIMKLSEEKQRLSKVYALLCAHNPLNVLNKGYSIIQTIDNEVISDVHKLCESEEVKITMKTGKVRANIELLEEL
jgi:exodeoxyribonuclease VII large subunit